MARMKVPDSKGTDRLWDNIKAFLVENYAAADHTHDGGIDEIPVATTAQLGGIIVGENLQITETGVLSVETATDAEEDNTKPITSAAVAQTVGNIETLLKTI